MSHEHPVWEILDRLQMDHREMGAKLTALRAQVASLSLEPPDRRVCAVCGIAFRSTAKLAEHGYVSHGGPVPEHWLAAEQSAADPSPEPEPEPAAVGAGEAA